MRIYFDACCLNRPFDNQSQERIRLEAEAVTLIVQMARAGTLEWVSSEALEEELSRISDEDKKISVTALLAHANERLMVNDAMFELARRLAAQGVTAMDAVHFAVAELGNCDILLTTDDAFIRKIENIQFIHRVRVANPARWVVEVFEQ
jgi:predicted nucleic acid-binding protein